jgi:hypothetical protein
MPDNIDPFEQLIENMQRKEFLADLFLILHFDETSAPTGEEPVLRVPESLHRLLIDWSNESQAIVDALVFASRPETRALLPDAFGELVEHLRARYLEFFERNLLIPIEDEADPQIAQIIRQLIPELETEFFEGRVTLRGSLLTRMRKVVRNSVTTTLSVSKRTGMGILMRGRDFSRMIRDRITQLELPAKSDRILESKAALTSRIFSFKGGRSTKFCVGLGLATAGVFTTVWPVTVGGLVFAFTDP